MQQSLGVRLAAAEKETETAKREKLEKEQNGEKILADHEKIMEKLVEEGNILSKQAEENAEVMNPFLKWVNNDHDYIMVYVDPDLLSNVLQLQKFLMDRGHVVDILQ